MTYFQLYFYMLHYKISLLTWKRLNLYLNIEFILPLPHHPRSSSHYPPYGSCRRCGQPRSPSDQCRWQPAYYCSPLQMTLPAQPGEVLLGNPDKSWIQKQIIKLLNTDLHITRSRLLARDWTGSRNLLLFKLWREGVRDCNLYVVFLVGEGSKAISTVSYWVGGVLRES